VKCAEAQELITGLVDNELSPQESALITAHFGECAECPKSFSREYALKRLLRNAATTIHAPTELRVKIARAQRRSPHKVWLSRSWRALPRAQSFAVQGAVLVALLAIPLFSTRYWLTSPYFPIVPGIFQSYRQITEGEIVPVKMKNLAELKERLTQLVDGQFAPMGYDFSSMNIHLVGGLLQEIANRKVLVALYQGNGLTIICYTFVGSDGDAPEIAEMFFDAKKGMDFHQFFYTHTNAVMHREGNINCILMSQMPKPDLLELARAKAHSS
jgi:Putative zinc-finger